MLLLLAGISPACNSVDVPQSDTEAWVETADSSSTRHLVESPSICSDCFSFHLVAVLGDDEGPGYLEATGRLLRDRRGRYWVGQPGTLKVFGASGRFVTEVGRAGEGPGEYLAPDPIYADSLDRIHIVDRHRPRLTILGSDLEVVRTSLLPGTRNAVALPMGGYVVNASIPERVELPLHIVDGFEPEPLMSFGTSPDGGPYSLRGLDSWRLMTADQDSRIIPSSLTEYLIEAWTLDGRRITGWRGPALNDPGVSIAPLSPDSPPDNRIVGIQLDEAGRLWVLSLQTSSDWRERLRRAVGPDGRTRWEPADQDLSSLFRGRIDVVDLDRGEVIARAEQARLFIGGLGDGLLFAEAQSDIDAPQLEVWKVGLTVPDR